MIQKRSLQEIAVFAGIAAIITVAALAGMKAAGLVALLALGIAVMFILWGYMPPEVEEEEHPSPHIIIASDILDNADFHKITEGFSDPVLVVEDERVVQANIHARNLLGNHITGQDVRVAIRHPAVAEHLVNQDHLEKSTRIDIVGLGTKDQHWSMNIITFGSGDKKRLFVHLTDESDLHTAGRMRGDFVANASHELRTPLAGILGFVETLQDPDAGGDTQTRERFLSIIQKEARRMQQLVDDLMSLSRIEADKYRLPATQVSLPALMEEVLPVCRLSLGERGQDIITAISDDVSVINGDKSQISQILHNLVSNSAKYGKPGTPITVRLTTAPPHMVRLEVCDEGEGISAEHLPRLTERFYRVDSGRSRAIGGTGLGLAIVKHIVERHRGRFDISSTVGKGTNISVLLPVAAHEAPEK